MNLLVFDSGIGGLGVVREIRRLQPRAGIIYLADNGFFPYGDQPDDELLRHILAVLGQAIDRFRPDALVIACNTASTIALPALRAAFPQPVIGCVPPIKPAAAASLSRRIGVLATKATAARPYLQSLIDEHAAGCTVYSLGTPSLALLAERKFRGHAVDPAAAIAPLFAQPGAALIDAIALGCTHYSFLIPEFRDLYPAISWFDPALPVARRTLHVTGSLASAAAAVNLACFTMTPDEPSVIDRELAAFGFAGHCIQAG
jgi:glutamate racemase